MDKIIKFLNSIIDLILPKDPEMIEIENMSEIDILNNVPQALEIKNRRFIAMFQHKNKISRKAIWAIKYNGNQKIIRKFSGLFYEFILESITDEIIFSKFNNPILIPIPMHKDNLKERGYNQSELITKEIFRIDDGKNFDILLKTLIKIKKTPHQSALKNKNERLKNLKNCFCANEKDIKNKNIILIDDVITTGTTMLEASRTLMEAGARKVIGFSLTH